MSFQWQTAQPTTAPPRKGHEPSMLTGFFDATVSIDAYHYLGTDDQCLDSHFARLVKPRGQIGIVVPVLVREFSSVEPPEHLRPYWDSGFSSFHSPLWWRRHWERSGLVTVELSDMVPNGWRYWAISRCHIGGVASRTESRGRDAVCGRWEEPGVHKDDRASEAGP